MKMGKRWLTVLLAICVLVVSVTPQATLAATVGTEADSTEADTDADAVSDAQDEADIEEDEAENTEDVSDAETSAELTSSVSNSAEESASEDTQDDQSENSIIAYEAETEVENTDTTYAFGSETGLSAPTGLSVSVCAYGLKLSWEAATDEDVDGYVIFRSDAETEEWTTDQILNDLDADSDPFTYADLTVESGKTYFYSVAAYTLSEHTKVIGVLAGAVSCMYLAEPEMETAEFTSTGLEISWDAVGGAESYHVYRKSGSDDEWTELGVIEAGETTYTDATAQTGTTYYYTVAACCGDNSSVYGDSIVQGSGAYLDTPSMKTPTALYTGTQIEWSAVENATGYAVYRKVSGGGWSMIATTTSTSYTDTSSLSDGKTYYYTVRAYMGSETTAKNNKYSVAYWSYYDTAGVKTVYLAVPSLKTATAAASGTQISWNKVTGASGYAVYRKKSGGSWSMIGTTTSTSYTDTTALSGGSTYYYTVRAYVGSASDAKSNKYSAAYWGGYNTTGSKSVYLAVPSLKTATAAATGTTVSWGKVTGASGYAIYRKKSGGSWSMIDTTTSTSYTDKTALSGGSTYYYTVRAYTGSVSTAKSNKYSASYWGGYNTTGSKSVYLANPSLSSTAVTSSKYVKVTWSKVTGASGYAVYRKVSGGSWSMIGTTTSTTYTDKQTLTSGKTYYYTVRAYTGSVSTAKSNKYNAAYWSGYNSTGVKFGYIRNSDGTLVNDTAMYNKAQSKSSSTKWLILVDCTKCRVGVFYGSKGNWDMKYYWSCSPGKSSTPTVKGEFTVKSKGKSFGTSSYTCWYYTQFYGNYLFHSVLYYPGSMTEVKDGRLGQNLSHGCVRLSLTNAKWIYDNIPIGTKVYIY